MRNKIVQFSFFILVSASLFAAAMTANRRYLVAEEPLKIYNIAEGDLIVDEIATGQQVPVVSCEDRKTNIFPIVETAWGKRGYIVFGKFHLSRVDVLNFNTMVPINFTCPN